ncbi:MULTISPECIES: ADP-ribosyltransferase [Nocardia]|uniref:ADP-ribosyltransferase n=1 Tax=Nocardia TaxID=1817 RepID=UPI000D69F662|nr:MULTISPECIES: ADP-ribosyltransferase [Nocardia]
MGDDNGFDTIPLAGHVLTWQGADRLSKCEREAIEAYALGGYERINQALRGLVPLSPELARRVDHIRSGLRKYPLTQTIRVTRETEAAVYGVEDENTALALANLRFKEAGFLSTSGARTPPHSTRYVDPLILDLIVPRGTPAFMLGDLAEFPEEREVLLVDATSYFILDVVRDKRRSMWRVRAIVLEGDQ